MLLPEKIISSETRFRAVLEEFFRKIFNDTILESHGLNHHRRVWNYAKDILSHLDQNGYQTSQIFIDKILIACYLHDSGMSVDSGFNHGIAGRTFCEQFLSEKKLPVSDFSDVLDAIENHDNKEYKIISNPDALLTVLSVADDLDALGFIGIYRYLEIYVKRQIPLKEIGSLITENCNKRFSHIIAIYGLDSTLVMKHAGRYEALATFFRSYNQQSAYYIFDNASPSGFCGVAEIIANSLTISDPGKYFQSFSESSSDPVILWYFGELLKEMNA